MHIVTETAIRELVKDLIFETVGGQVNPIDVIETAIMVFEKNDLDNALKEIGEIKDQEALVKQITEDTKQKNPDITKTRKMLEDLMQKNKNAFDKVYNVFYKPQ